MGSQIGAKVVVSGNMPSFSDSLNFCFSENLFLAFNVCVLTLLLCFEIIRIDGFRKVSFELNNCLVRGD